MAATPGTAERRVPRTHRPRRRILWRRVPTPLALLLIVVIVVGVFWALLVPPWQSPDELDHFAYAQSLAERFALPGDAHRAPFSDDEVLAAGAAGAQALAFQPAELRPNWSAAAFGTYQAAARKKPSRSNGGGPNPEAYDPPLYYLYSDLAYWATYGGNAFDRYYAMRIWGVSLLLVTVVGTWLLIGEVLGPRRRVPQLAGTAVVGLFPGLAFISTSVNPDALMIALWTLALWLGTRVIKRGARPRDVVPLCAVTAAGALTQPISYALVPAVVLALLIGWLRSPAGERGSRIWPTILAGAICGAPVAAWVATRVHGNPALADVAPPAGQHSSPFLVRQFLSYLWQFYLPRLPGMTLDRVTPGLSLYNVWVRQAWGTFGWNDVPMASWVYTVAASFTGLVAVAAAAIVSRFRDRLRWELFAFFAVALVVLLFGLHLTEYRSLISGTGAFLQGRYILPVLGLFGVAVALVVSVLPRRWQGPACGALVPAMLLLQVIALSTVAATYYT